MGTRIGRSVKLKGVEADKRRFITSYLEGLKFLHRNFVRFLSSPGEEETHDVRTATRRAEAHLTLLPRKVRGERSCKELKRGYQKVMGRTAKVRDMDILRAKLSETPDGKEMVHSAAIARKKAVEAACRAIISAGKLSGLEFRATDIHGASLQRRFDKVTARLAADVDRTVPAVVDDPSDMRDLHRLRIDIKRLRYVLESVTARGSERSAELEEVQDALGSIHDWDVSIDYVKRAHPKSRVVSTWAAQREQEFKRFVRTFCFDDEGPRTGGHDRETPTGKSRRQ